MVLLVYENMKIDPIQSNRALMINPPKTARPIWVNTHKSLFCKGPVTSGLNELGEIMIKAPDHL